MSMDNTAAILPVRVDMPFRDESGAALFTITLLDAIEPLRLDKFISLVLPDVTRSKIERLIGEGQITMNGRTVSKGGVTVKRPPIQVKVFVPPPPPTELVPLDMALDIIHEDEHIIVLNKPAGLVMHPAAGHTDDTLTNALVFHFDKLSKRGGEFRLGVVHRLDKDTSGVLVVTKDDRSHLDLSNQLSARTVHKMYIAVTFGTPKPPAGKIETMIIRHPRHRKKFTSRTQRGRNAITLYEALDSDFGLAVIACTLKTGRTHQIRVHLSEQLNCPIVGDELYGASKRIKSIQNSDIKQCLSKINRQLLHAFSLSFIHPATKKEMYFEAPLPDDIAPLIEAISGRAAKDVVNRNTLK